MQIILKNKFVQIGIFNLLIVSILGVAMRMKILFEIPFIDQKNLQLAHSNFAFSAWISFALMSLLVHAIQKENIKVNISLFNKIIVTYLICNYFLLCAFLIQGYGIFSISLLLLSHIITVIFSIYFFKSIQGSSFNAKRWFFSSLVFNLLSLLGSGYLAYMIFIKNLVQHQYLASTYWYLHFQYNGWFFFACMGLFLHYLSFKNLYHKSMDTIFWLLALSCIPAYGLSILWAKISSFQYMFFCLAAFIQFIGIVYFFRIVVKHKLIDSLQLSTLQKNLLIFVTIALFIKYCLQLGSTIPAINQFAFGFRPIVIAYLHLVLLAFTSGFLINYLYMNNFIAKSKLTSISLITIFLGILGNEIILAIQGIGSIKYIAIPHANVYLLILSMVILFGVSLLFKKLFD